MAVTLSRRSKPSVSRTCMVSKLQEVDVCGIAKREPVQHGWRRIETVIKHDEY